MTGTCQVCAADDPHPVICYQCAAQIRRDLDTIGKARRRLTPIPGRTGSGGRAAGKPGSRPPANLTVLAMTDPRSRLHIDEDGTTGPDAVVAVDAELLTQARRIITARHLDVPLRDVFDAIRTLNRNFDWLLRTPHIDDTAAALHHAATALAAATHDRLDPTIGPCPLKDPAGHDDRCGGPLRFAYRGPLTPDLPPAPTHVVCGRCRSAWDVDDYLWQLLRVSRPHGRYPVARDWACRTYNLDPALLRKWIQRGHIRTYQHGQIDILDVLQRLREDQPR